MEMRWAWPQARTHTSPLQRDSLLVILARIPPEGSAVVLPDLTRILKESREHCEFISKLMREELEVTLKRIHPHLSITSWSWPSLSRFSRIIQDYSGLSRILQDSPGLFKRLRRWLNLISSRTSPGLSGILSAPTEWIEPARDHKWIIKKKWKEVGTKRGGGKQQNESQSNGINQECHREWLLQSKCLL